jgi:hypothetical protein
VKHCEIVLIFELDWASGVVTVNGTPRIADEGFSMGSGLAPGGACLLAANREQEEVDAEPIHVQREFAEGVLVFRWVDDLNLIRKRILSVAADGLARRIVAVDFYGPTLRLERVPSRVSFGFRFDITGGRVKVRQAAKYIEDYRTRGFVKRWAVVQGEDSFAAPHIVRATTAGHFTRLLDLTNEDARGVSSQMERLVWELRRVDISSRVIASAVRKLRGSMWIQIPCLEQVALCSARDAGRLCLAFDIRETVEEVVHEKLNSSLSL